MIMNEKKVWGSISTTADFAFHAFLPDFQQFSDPKFYLSTWAESGQKKYTFEVSLPIESSWNITFRPIQKCPFQDVKKLSESFC